MLREIFRNNVLFLLKENGKTFNDLKKFLDEEEIVLLGMLDGEIMHTIRELKLLGEFFDIGFQKLYQPLTKETFELFSSKEEREKYEEELEQWRELRRNQTVDFSGIKKVREFKPKKQ